ncbi:MAG: ABC transporter permease, partial [Muribaculaceae bacterium]|nr:ABC transporter permease [Muribaculaceae bacterium]
DMRHQKMMTWVAISGTAVSIFLVMVMFMVNSLKTVEVAPDINRQRIYAGMTVTIKSTNPEDNWMTRGNMAYPLAQRLYGDLKGVELVSYCGQSAYPRDVIIKDKVPVNVSTKMVDGNFWKMFDFNFLEGEPFTEDDCLGNTNKIVLTRSLAHRLFSTQEVVGREINLGRDKYVISGVVEDVNPILQNIWADVYTPVVSSMREDDISRYNACGYFMALMLYEKETDPESVKAQVKSRYATLNAEWAKEGAELVYNGVPYDAEQLGMTDVGYVEPDVKKEHRTQYIIYALLLLLPAINLSSMMRGRLRHRVSEIGVRRAYGAKRRDIIRQLIGENLVVTVVGGLIGLGLSYLFMLTLSSEFFMFVDGNRISSLEAKMATPSFGMLFTWSTFFISVGACLVLNLLTATVPAWRASMMEPAVAISKSRT